MIIKIVLRERPEVRAPEELGAGREEGLRGVTRLVEVGLSSPTRLTSLFANLFQQILRGPQNSDSPR